MNERQINRGTKEEVSHPGKSRKHLILSCCCPLAFGARPPPGALLQVLAARVSAHHSEVPIGLKGPGSCPLPLLIYHLQDPNAWGSRQRLLQGGSLPFKTEHCQLLASPASEPACYGAEDPAAQLNRGH